MAYENFSDLPVVIMTGMIIMKGSLDVLSFFHLCPLEETKLVVPEKPPRARKEREPIVMSKDGTPVKKGKFVGMSFDNMNRGVARVSSKNWKNMIVADLFVKESEESLTTRKINSKISSTKNQLSGVKSMFQAKEVANTIVKTAHKINEELKDPELPAWIEYLKIVTQGEEMKVEVVNKKGVVVGEIEDYEVIVPTELPSSGIKRLIAQASNHFTSYSQYEFWLNKLVTEKKICTDDYNVDVIVPVMTNKNFYLPYQLDREIFASKLSEMTDAGINVFYDNSVSGEIILRSPIDIDKVPGLSRIGKKDSSRDVTIRIGKKGNVRISAPSIEVMEPVYNIFIEKSKEIVEENPEIIQGEMWKKSIKSSV